MPSVEDASAAPPRAAPPSLVMRVAVSSAPCASRSPTTTDAPAAASATANSRPIPEPAPVTTATLPSICMPPVYRTEALGLRENPLQACDHDGQVELELSGILADALA